MYDIYAINRKTGLRVKMNAYPLTLIQARANKAKITEYIWRAIEIVESEGA